jgi:hypothetical protein
VHLVKSVLIAVVGIPVLFSLYFLMVNHSAFLQKRDKVVIREAGRPLLGPPIDIIDSAREDLPFALLSQAAYQKTENEGVHDGECLKADDILKDKLGWNIWPDFPDDILLTKIKDSHLRVEVWSNEQSKEVVVAFGGTVFRSLPDWRSNLRWFTKKRHDEYTDIVDTFNTAFIDAYSKYKTKPGWEYVGESKIFATGHSLGAGLAQEFAYSLPGAGGLQVTKVYAFDPSPVTGYATLDEPTAKNNCKGLEIDRIYERGEILALLRSFTNFFDPPSALNPKIRQIRYNLFSRAPITGHSIAKLACKLNGVVHPD